MPEGACSPVTCQPMPKRVTAPKFGDFIKTARKKRGLKSGQVVGHVHRVGAAFDTFDPSQLSTYEHGKVASPDPIVLYLLARLYHVSLDAMIETLIEDRLAVGKAPPERRTASR